MQGWPVVAQQMGSDTCCVVTASHFCTSVVSFHSHPQQNSRSEGEMSKSWCTSRQIMLRWFTVAEVLQLPVTITRISGVPFTYLRNCNSTCKVILFRYLLCGISLGVNKGWLHIDTFCILLEQERLVMRNQDLLDMNQRFAVWCIYLTYNISWVFFLSYGFNIKKKIHLNHWKFVTHSMFSLIRWKWIYILRICSLQMNEKSLIVLTWSNIKIQHVDITEIVKCSKKRLGIC